MYFQVEALLVLLPAYEEHLRKYPMSFICRFYGLYSLKLPGSGIRLFVLLMGNVFHPDGELFSGNNSERFLPMPETREVFDLKGSTVGRSVLKISSSDSQTSDCPPELSTLGVLKDADFLALHPEGLNVGPSRQMMVDQLKADAELLRSHGLMDYSLIVRIQVCMVTQNEESLNDLPLRSDELLAKPAICGAGEIWAIPHGGSSRLMYMMGVVDILQRYDISKKLERGLKTIRHANPNVDISSVNPDVYFLRFCEFVKDSLR